MWFINKTCDCLIFGLINHLIEASKCMLYIKSSTISLHNFLRLITFFPNDVSEKCQFLYDSINELVF